MSLQIVEWPDFLANSPAPGLRSAMSIGVFDGLHLGHRSLIGKIVSRGPNPTLLTFKENPKKQLSPENYEGDLFSFRQKMAALGSLGLSRLVLIDFSLDFSRLKGDEFLDILRVQGGLCFMAVGTNFRCGYRQDTDAGLIREINGRNGINTELVPPVELESAPVSSSRVRTAVSSGDLRLAAALMGKNLELDLSDLIPVEETAASSVYDFGLVQRIIPADGDYPVLLHPGALDGQAHIKDRMVFLSRLKAPFSHSLERLEFIN
jgi:riboflavin kinase/FMN adenylyltransferase